MAIHRSRAAGLRFSAWAALALAAFPGHSLFAVDFIRGDANNDGVVSISDAHMILGYLFRFQEAPTCMEAADANASGLSHGAIPVDISDAAAIVSHLFLRGNWRFYIPPPYPEAGPDPMGCDTSLPSCCEFYGGVGPIEDPQAALEIVDFTCPGGADRSATIHLAVSSSRKIGGISGTIRPPAGFELDLDGPVKVIPSYKSAPFSMAFVEEGAIKFGLIVGYAPPFLGEHIPPGDRVEVLAIPVQLRPGTYAGEYSLALESVELIDFETSRAIHPLEVGGSLTVAQPVPLVDILTFFRGDSNGDQEVDLSDATFTLSHLFLGGPRPPCLDAADANDDGQVDIADPLSTLSFLFLGGARPPAPYPTRGDDPTPDGFICITPKG